MQPPAPVWALLLSEAVGTCFTASVLLLKSNLPHKYRAAVTAALTGEDIATDNTAALAFTTDYQRLFDTVFLCAAVASAVVLFSLRQGKASG